MFNTKSRFAVLTEERNINEKQNNQYNEKQNNNNIKKQNTEQPKFNNFKEDRPKYEGANIFSNKTLEKEENKNLKNLSLSTENFPELVSVGKKVNTIESTSFLEKAKKEEKREEKEVINIIKDEIPYGCALIKRCKSTNRMILKYDPEYEKVVNYEKKIKEENESIYEDQIINSLVNLHVKRKQEYIDNWGYDDYETTFLFPYYDYEYFDKLDAIYEEEMERLREQEEQEENNNELINYDLWRY
jgi:hypothetical protein